MTGGRRPAWVLLALCVEAAAAQQRTGSLEVKLGDAAGAPVPGATVYADRAAASGRRSCTTGLDGRCVMLAVEPGRYRVAAESPHLADALVDLAPGDHALVTLAPAGPRDGREATVAPPLPPAAGLSLSRELLAALPAGRGLLDALRIRAEQPSTGNWRLHGPPPASTRLFVEGFEWGERPGSWPGPRAEALGALRFDGPLSADARSARGIDPAITAVLRPGGTRFSGEARFTYENSRLSGSPRPFSRYSPWNADVVERGLTVPTTPWSDLTPAVVFGGPLGARGLSFHASSAYSRRARHRDVTFLDDPDRAPRRFRWFSWSADASLNLLASAGAARRARLALVYGRGRNRGGAPALEPDQGRLPDGSSTAGLTRAPFLGADATIARWRDTGSDSRRIALTPTLDWPIGEAWSVSADASWSWSNSWTPPSFRGAALRHVFVTSNARIPGIRPEEVHPAGYADHPSSYGTVRDRAGRQLLQVEARWMPGRRASHLVTAGIRAERRPDDVYIGHAKPLIRLHWNRAPQTSAGDQVTGRYGYYTVSRPGTIGEAAGTIVAAWLQDRWSPAGGFTLSAGIRAEREAAPSYSGGSGATSPLFGFGDKLAPRLSAQWRPDEAGAWRLDGSFGLYFDHLTTNLARALFGARHDVRESWTLETLDWRTLACDEGRRDCPGLFVRREDASPPWTARDPALSAWFGSTSRIDPALRPMETGEWGAGVERRLPGRASIALRYTGKWLVRAVEDVGLSLPGIGEVEVLANPGFGYAREAAPEWPGFPLPRAARRYHEVEVELRRGGRPIALAARYRWSRLWGNYGGVAASDEGGRESTNLTSAFDALYSSYDRRGRAVDGPLPGDRPHRLNLDATLVLPRGTTAALSAVLESGAPDSSWVRFRGAPVWFDGFGNLGRQPAFSQVDLQVRQEIHLGHRVATLEATVDNVFDQATALGSFSTNPYRDDLRLPVSAFFDLPWDPAEWASRLRSAGIRVRDEQLFGVPDRFQRPRRVTLTAGFSF